MANFMKKKSFKLNFEGGEIDVKSKDDHTLYGEDITSHETGYSEKTYLGGILSLLISVFIGYFILHKVKLITSLGNDFTISTSYHTKKHL